MYRESFNASPTFQPAYLSLYQSGELQQRARDALAELSHCTLCPRACQADRAGGELGTCQIGRYARLTSYFPHFGEEDPLRGWNGSGTLFFAQCNLRCVFCQNYDISQSGNFPETSPLRLAEMMLELQAMGCHNINLVTPSHVVPHILEALLVAVAAGLRLPLVYNTSGYDTVETLRRLDGVVDIYMPDFKMWDEQHAAKYLHAKDYPQVARQALREMHRQVGVLKLDERGLARRGVLVRHLVMPEGIAGTESVAGFLANELSPDTYVNLMAQYHPAGKVSSTAFNEINRRITHAEFNQALQAARRTGLHRFD
ncbi:MAG: radical SAM protein [Anaerolineales bacterium]|nr:radical SAM protein [Anaerolineales bacterium]